MAVGLPFDPLLRPVAWCLAEVHRAICSSEAKPGGLQGPGMFSFPAQSAASNPHTHTHTGQAPWATRRTPQTQEQAPYTHKQHVHKQMIPVI